MLRDLRVRAGQPISFNVNVEGEPNPKIVWQVNGASLTSSERTKIDNSKEHNTKLNTEDSVRGDSGTYKIIATNEHGTDEAEVKVVVLGKDKVSDKMKVLFRRTRNPARTT